MASSSMGSMGYFEVISFTAAISSVILAIVAIWLSIVFYKMSSGSQAATTEAAKGIAASVERLEKLFDKLYSDTFSMMRETVSDMRKHIWPAEDAERDKTVEEVEAKADEKVAELKKAMESQLAEMLQRQRIADDQVSALRGEMRTLIERAIVGSRQVDAEAREETVREHILRSLRVLGRTKTHVLVKDIVERMTVTFPLTRVITEIQRLRDEKLIHLVPDEIQPGTVIHVLRPGEDIE